MIKVLIAEDSLVDKEYLSYILSQETDIEILGVAKDGKEAVELSQILKPDVIVMDIHMPKMDGFQSTRKIMETNPVPIIIISSSDITNDTIPFLALKAGAVTVLAKPYAIGHPEQRESSQELVQKIRLMSQIKVIKRVGEKDSILPKKIISKPISKPLANIDLVVIGASTGGPPVIQKILSELPINFAPAILIVQHISVGFTKMLAEWLKVSSKLPCKIASNNESVLLGQVYIAPDNFHMQITPDKKISLTNDPAENGLRPAVSCLFRSVASNFSNNVIGILLTGMGKDGAAELKLIKDKGAITVAQDETSSVVYGMPGEAVKLGATTYVLSPDEIVSLLKILTK
ncbi:MAG: chemotaxis-specific protein-glutamate methyltransferase CheB [Acidobacteria bacterium]|nr:chemotaxis-specific protein-glutamate methyltransferase CheB [Acidobacteriota bacterium]